MYVYLGAIKAPTRDATKPVAVNKTTFENAVLIPTCLATISSFPIILIANWN